MTQNETICKKRYQQIAITALGNINTTGTRILQTPSQPVYYTMNLEVSTSDFTDASCANFLMIKLLSFSIIALAMMI